MNNDSLARQVGESAMAERQTLATAESCTGGLVAAQCTSVSGSSNWFHGGFVTYSLDAKKAILGVPEALLSKYGAVSEPVAGAMARGALNRCNADMAVSVTGIAGPDGGDVDRPVGMVWFGWARWEDGKPSVVQTSAYDLEGDRTNVREQAVRIALEGFLKLLTDS